MTYLIGRRFAELVFLCGILSATVSALSKTSISAMNGLVPLCMLIFTVLFLIVNIIMLRRCYFDVVGMAGRKDYYIGNFIAYIIFALINILMCMFVGDVIYTWLFAITKFARFFGENVSKIESALIFHMIMLMTIIVAPFGMDELYAWRFK